MRTILLILLLGVTLGQEEHRSQFRRRNSFIRTPSRTFNPFVSGPDQDEPAFDRPPPRSFNPPNQRPFIPGSTPLIRRPESLGELPLERRPEYHHFEFAPVEDRRTLTENVALSDGELLSLGDSGSPPPGLAETALFELDATAPDAPYGDPELGEEDTEFQFFVGQENEVESKVLSELLSEIPDEPALEHQPPVEEIKEEVEDLPVIEERKSDEVPLEPRESIIDAKMETLSPLQEFSETEQQEYRPFESPSPREDSPFHQSRPVRQPSRPHDDRRPLQGFHQQIGNRERRPFRHNLIQQEKKKQPQSERFDGQNYQNSNIFSLEFGSGSEHQQEQPAVREVAGVVKRRRPNRPIPRDEYEYPPVEVNHVDNHGGFVIGEEDEEEEKPDRLTILLQQTDFNCLNKKDGYYADEQLDCEVFHFCQDRTMHSWLCPNSASFHQVHLICLPRSEDNICKKSSKFHFVNDYLYKESADSSDKKKLYMQRYYPKGYTEGIAALEERQAISNDPEEPQNEKRVNNFRTQGYRRPSGQFSEVREPHHQNQEPSPVEDHESFIEHFDEPQDEYSGPFNPSQEEHPPFRSPYQVQERPRVPQGRPGGPQRVRPGSFIQESNVRGPPPRGPPNSHVRPYRHAPPAFRRHSLYL